MTVNFPALGWTLGIVQFGHHSYTPLKDCESHPVHLRAEHVALGQHPDQPRETLLPVAGHARADHDGRDSNARTLSFGGAGAGERRALVQRQLQRPGA